MTHEEIEAAIERLEKLEEEKSYVAYDMMRALIGRDSLDLYYNIGALKALLQQADPDTHMELPVDADGERIHLGDELCGYGRPDGGVYCQAIVNESIILVGETSIAYKDWLLWDTADCRHRHKPTVEDVLREMLEKVVGFSYARTTVALNAISECAAKLREVMADDDAVLLTESVKEYSDLARRAESLRDCLGEFITSLLYESPIGDGRAGHDDAR